MSDRQFVLLEVGAYCIVVLINLSMHQSKKSHKSRLHVHSLVIFKSLKMDVIVRINKSWITYDVQLLISETTETNG